MYCTHELTEQFSLNCLGLRDELHIIPVLVVLRLIETIFHGSVSHNLGDEACKATYLQKDPDSRTCFQNDES